MKMGVICGMCQSLLVCEATCAPHVEAGKGSFYVSRWGEVSVGGRYRGVYTLKKHYLYSVWAQSGPGQLFGVSLHT